MRVYSSLYPDQARQNVGPDLDPNCLHRLVADNTSSQELRDMESESARRILFLVTKVTSQDSDKPAYSCRLPQSLPVDNATLMHLIL